MSRRTRMRWTDVPDRSVRVYVVLLQPNGSRSFQCPLTNAANAEGKDPCHRSNLYYIISMYEIELSNPD